jgi:tripartite-type tricarboxylate transporter receptor subunit TctC
MTHAYHRVCDLALGALGGLLVAAAPASAAEDFYAGKQITFIASNTGSYEAYCRYLAKHMPKYIPGNPRAISQIMTGASGLAAANYIYNGAPRDGTAFAITQGQVPFSPMTNPDSARFEPTKFTWIGSATKDTFIGYMWHEAKVKTLEDTKKIESLVGGQAVGSMSINMAILGNAMFDMKFKIITGYGGSAETKFAVEKREIDGHFGTDINSVRASNPDWFTQKKINIITQFGFTKASELPEVPLFIDQSKTPADRQLLEALLSGSEIGKPLYGPPDIPAERVAIIREAFNKTVKDPAFIADLGKEGFPVHDPMNGEAALSLVTRVMATPPEVIKRTNTMFEDFRRNK